MLDGLLPLLARCLRSRHADIVSLALRIHALLVPLPLPGQSVAGSSYPIWSTSPIMLCRPTHCVSSSSRVVGLSSLSVAFQQCACMAR
jgi:hypothetical protein